MSITLQLPNRTGAVEQTHQRQGNADAYTLGDSTRIFLVSFPNASYDDSSALFHPDIPLLRSAHPTRVGLWLTNKAARNVDDKNGCLWEVVCTYGVGSGAIAPWYEPAVYSWGAQASDTICDFDLQTQKPIRNSAGCPFDPGVTAQRYDATLSVARNELNFDYSNALKYVGACNGDSFYGAGEGYAMCIGINAQQQIYQNESGLKTQYWSVSYNFAFRNLLSFQAHVLDAGFMKLKDDGTLIPITIAGREPSAPVPLDGEGQPLANPETDEPHWLDFKIYPQVSFSSLGI